MDIGRARAAFDKRLLVIRSQLIGRRYHGALRALEFAMRHHVKVRKDGFTPEFDHQLQMSLFALTLPDLMHPEEVVATVFLHDTGEDYHVSGEEMRLLFPEAGMRERVVQAVERLTKKFRGRAKDEDELFAEMAEDPVASVVKLCDRMHNLQTMVGVFGHEKQVEYVEFAEEHILPMGKRARRNFPEQTAAYENLKTHISNQIFLIRAIHEAAATPTPSP